jgi:hypothetical protein
MGFAKRNPSLTRKTVESGGIEIGWDGYKQEGDSRIWSTAIESAFTLAKPRVALL